MAEPYRKQHIVSRRYLDRFGEKSRSGNYIIGCRLKNKDEIKFFTSPTKDVCYENNIYDVTDKDDPKYWEHFFNNEYDSLCGDALGTIISVITLSKNNNVVLSEYFKEILSKLIVSQMIRIPGSIEHMDTVYARVSKEVKKKVKNDIKLLYPTSYQKYYKIADRTELTSMQQKEIYFNKLFAEEMTDKSTSLIKDKIWIVYYNAAKDVFPFITSDNPVLIQNPFSHKSGIFNIGLSNVGIEIFYALSPSIAIALYDKKLFGHIYDDYNNRKIILDRDDYKYILGKNMQIIEHSQKWVFIPEPMFSIIKNNK